MSRVIVSFDLITNDLSVVSCRTVDVAVPKPQTLNPKFGTSDGWQPLENVKLALSAAPSLCRIARPD